MAQFGQLPRSNSRASTPSYIAHPLMMNSHAAHSDSPTPQSQNYSQKSDSVKSDLKGLSSDEEGSLKVKEQLKSDIAKPITPLTPAKTLINQLKKRLEVRKSVDNVCTPDKTSPGLEKLRNTPVSQGLKTKRRILEAKHLEAKSNAALMHGIGGGISLWPHMENMRLDLKEVATLAITSCCLLAVTAVTFFSFHGQALDDLESYASILPSYRQQLPALSKRENFVDGLLVWHADFTGLVGQIEERFSLIGIDAAYISGGIVYIAGMSSLLYLLIENIFSKNRLTPRRIKIWVSLLVVLGAWTVLTLYLYVAAYRLEMSLQSVLQTLENQLGELVFRKDLQLSTYHNICRYWSTRYLPPRGTGFLSLFGVVSLVDVSFYLSYYCVPVATALLSPVVHLVMSLMHVYAPTPNVAS